MKLVRIPTSNLDEVWILVKKDIANALSYSGKNHNSQFVLDTLKKEEMQLWVIWDKEKSTTKEKYYGVVVTEIIKRTLRKVCHVFIVTGKQRQMWIPLIKVIEDFAEENECNGIELIARPGWQKVLQNYKYKRTHVVLEKSITKKDK
tara:strand:+ start:103 stop:543 length:441 start_codon:yes stop_codon:yes gene_type:complete